MKSLGKQTVHCKSFCDNVLRKEWEQKRVVYMKKDGTFWVNYWLGGKSEAKHNNGRFEFEYHARSVRVMTFDDIISGEAR